ncbi:MAG: type II toxin-antitoxin system death-on-curing family toxin [Proteobacteria bacterium]|nr:type II toxin-antitoxin system death-on-curing family toxin [Pseudomonadota bacterium]
MTEPLWLDKRIALAMHETLIRDYGGSAGVRDEGLLESALARPQNQLAYGDPTLAEMAAAYAFGIARNHPFVDGNKRTALMAAYAFLRMNGLRLTAPEVEAATVIRDLAAGEIGEKELAAWITANLEEV